MYNKATVTRLKNYLIEDGAVLENEAETGSVYFKAGDMKIRISDHLPKIHSADLIIMYTINMDTYVVSLHGTLICFKSLADLRQFTRPLILSALLRQYQPDYVNWPERLETLQEQSSKIIDEKNSRISHLERELEKTKKQFNDSERRHELEKQTFIAGDTILDGYGRTYRLGSFSASQIRTIQNFIDSNRHMGKIGFCEEKNT